MNELAAHEVGVLLLSFSFGVALIAGGIAGKLGGFQAGVAAGLASVGASPVRSAVRTKFPATSCRSPFASASA